MELLYIGSLSGTSLQRREALRRIGHSVTAIDPETFLPRNRVAAKIHYETGGLLLAEHIRVQILRELETVMTRFDVVWVDNGRYVGSELVRSLQKQFGPVVLYNVDDPYGRRDRFSFELVRRTLPEYDLVVVVRTPNIAEAKALGARRVMHQFRCADEVAHAPRSLSADDQMRFDSEVLFVGTCFPERAPFMSALKDLGVPLTIRGNQWDRSREWNQLKDNWASAVDNPCDYSLAIQCAKINLGMVSKGNRDLHTTRSMEIPYMGGLLCAERTEDHTELYVEGREAVFWSDATECATICRELLANDEKRSEIARNGQIRALKNANTNEALGRRILDALVPFSAGG